MNFSAALYDLKAGAALRRPGWAMGTHVQIENGTIKLVQSDQYKNVWRPDSTEMLADDWEATAVSVPDGDSEPDQPAENLPGVQPGSLTGGDGDGSEQHPEIQE